MKKNPTYAEKIIRKLAKTDRKALQNRLLGMVTIILGIVSAKLTGDGTAMIMLLFMGIAAIIN